jgi:hypothetical protein
MLEVTVSLPSRPDPLYMNTDGTGSDDGFASYVRDLSLVCGSTQIRLTRHAAIWEVGEGGASGPCVASYRVDLSFTRSEWEAENEQAGYSDELGTFLSN